MKKFLSTLVPILACVSTALGSFQRFGASRLVFVPDADTTPPTLTSSTVATSGNTISFLFSEPVTFTASTGWTTSLSGGAATLTYSSGDTTSTLVYAISRTVSSGETGTVSYVQPGTGIRDPSANTLANITGATVTNGSTAGSGMTANLWQSFENATLSNTNLGLTDHDGTGSWSVTQGTSSTVSNNATGQKATTSNVNSGSTSGSFGLKLAKADGTNAYVHYAPASGKSSYSIAAWVFIPTLPTDGNGIGVFGDYNVTDVNITRDTGGAHYVAFPGSPSSGIAVTPGNWYWITALIVQNSTCKLRVYDSSGTQVGTEKTTTGNNNTITELFLFADFGAQNYTATFYMDNLVIDWTSSTYPLGP